MLLEILGTLLCHKDLQEPQLVDAVLLPVFLALVAHFLNFPNFCAHRLHYSCGNAHALLQLRVRSIIDRHS